MPLRGPNYAGMRSNFVSGMAAHSLGHHLRFEPARIVETRGMDRDQVRHCSKCQFDRRLIFTSARCGKAR
jgi:hypothetical protein